MRHIVRWNGNKLRVVLPDAVPDGQAFSFTVDGRAYRGTWIRRHAVLAVTDADGNGVERLLRVRSYKATRFDGEADTDLIAEFETGPRVRPVAAQVGYDMPGQTSKTVATREQVVRSQITGKVLKVLVREGEVVTQGQALLTIEAMKMENRVFAAAAGKIKTVNVKDGDAVTTGKELVRISP